MLQASGAGAALDPELFIRVTGDDSAIAPPGLSPSPSSDNSAADADASPRFAAASASSMLPPPGLSSMPSYLAAAPASASSEARCPVAESAAVSDWDAAAAQLAPPATRPKTNITVVRRTIFAELGRLRELPRDDAAELEYKAAKAEKAAAQRQGGTAAAEASPDRLVNDSLPAPVRLCQA